VTGAGTGTQEPVLHLSAVVKTFPGQVALDGAGLAVGPGEIHALVGQNGSGKSTMIKLLAGYHSPDSVGEATMDGAAFSLGSADDADRLGMRFVHQNLGLVESMTVVENCALTRGFPTGHLWRINWRAEQVRVSGLLERFGVDLDTTCPVGRLAPAQRTMVAIVRALQDWEQSARILVLDEPTATLPASEVERLFEVVRRVAASGLGVLFVSHRLDEVFEIASQVTVFRDGKTVLSAPTSELDHGALVRAMLGRSIAAWETVGVPDEAGSALVVEQLAGLDLRSLSLTVRRGEIVGLAGLLGSGRDEVCPLVSGAVPRAGGTVTVGGRPVAKDSPRAALRAGIATVPVDRPRNGAVPTFSVGENIVLPRLGPLVRRGVLRRRLQRRESRRWVEQLDVRPADPQRTFLTLSGGNQQKVVLAKCLRLDPEVLLLDEPTQGVDVGAKVALYSIVAARAEDGLAVVVSSGDSEELARLCHRVLVLVDGAVAREISGPALTPEAVDLAVLGLQAQEGVVAHVR
jgi:ribose transport system ATP-binding protein